MMKIAAATEDRRTLSSHFGRAPFYLVFSLEDGQVVAVTERSKPFHGQHHNHSNADHNRLHEDMFAPLADCQVLMVGGMGDPAYQKALSNSLEVILIGGEITQAVQAYLRGEAVSDPSRVHHH